MALPNADQDLLVGLINSRDVADGVDLLDDAGAAGWLHAHGGTGGRVEEFGLESLRRLREGLRELAIANNGGTPDAEMLGHARLVIASFPLSVQLGDVTEEPALAAPPGAGPAHQLLAAAVGAYLAERARGSWHRVRACAAPDCRYAYLDTSRNGSRRWCDMAECGNRAKNRAWRARQDR